MVREIQQLDVQVKNFASNATRNRLTRENYAQMFRNVDWRFNEITKRYNDLGNDQNIYFAYREFSDVVRNIHYIIRY